MGTDEGAPVLQIGALALQVGVGRDVTDGSASTILPCLLRMAVERLAASSAPSRCRATTGEGSAPARTPAVTKSGDAGSRYVVESK